MAQSARPNKKAATFAASLRDGGTVEVPAHPSASTLESPTVQNLTRTVVPDPDAVKGSVPPALGTWWSLAALLDALREDATTDAQRRVAAMGARFFRDMFNTSRPDHYFGTLYVTDSNTKSLPIVLRVHPDDREDLFDWVKRAQRVRLAASFRPGEVATDV